MSNITLETVPSSLKSDKLVVPFILRSTELEEVNPIVSYYCKIFVLEHILNNKLHTTNKEVEVFTIALLEDTEKLKSTEDESLVKVLNDKSLSLGAVMSFSYTIFNQCLQELQKYNGTNKAQLVSKFKAGLNFMSLLSVFTEDSIDYAKLTGAKANDPASFSELNKGKIKLLKFQLARLLKDEIDVNDDGLEAELNQELAAMEKPNGEADEQSDKPEKSKESKEAAPKDSNPDKLANDKGLVSSGKTDNPQDNKLGLPGTPTSIAGSDKKHDDEANDDKEITLPGAPHFLPEDEDEDIKLPGAPKFLPDNDLSHINKSSSIHMFQPENSQDAVDHPKDVPKSSKAPAKPSAHHTPHEQLTKENVSSIVDKTDLIAKVQKHAKFAVSALNYEDFETAERELVQGLELLRAVKR